MSNDWLIDDRDNGRSIWAQRIPTRVICMEMDDLWENLLKTHFIVT